MQYSVTCNNIAAGCAGCAVGLELSFIVFMFYKQPEPDIGLIIKG